MRFLKSSSDKEELAIVDLDYLLSTWLSKGLIGPGGESCTSGPIPNGGRMVSLTPSGVEHQNEIILCNYDCCVFCFVKKTLPKFSYDHLS